MSQSAKHALVKMLARKDYFTFEARRKLVDKGFEPQEVTEALKAFESYMDDARREKAFVSQQLAKGYGPHVIAQKLWQKGGKLTQPPSFSAQTAAIESFITKKGKNKEKRQLFADLMRRGFEVDAIKDALNSSDPV